MNISPEYYPFACASVIFFGTIIVAIIYVTIRRATAHRKTYEEFSLDGDNFLPMKNKEL